MSRTKEIPHGKPLEYHIPCPHCGSSDAVTKFQHPKGHSYYKCFSGNCGRIWDEDKDSTVIDFTEQKAYRESMNTSSAVQMPNEYAPGDNHWGRGLTEETFNAFGVTCSEDGSILFFPHYDYNGNLTGYKQKTQDKKFYWHGDARRSGLFGNKLFKDGTSRRAVTVTEGQEDAMAVYQMFGSKYAAVSIVAGAESAKNLSQEDIKFLSSFEEVVICFDSDEPGRKGAKALARSFGTGVKVSILDLSLKDANEYLKAGREEEFRKAWFNNKKPYRPDGLVYSSETSNLISEYDPKPDAYYPWSGLNQILWGIYKPSLIVVTAGSGVGKCFRKGTKILMYGGSIKAVEDVVVGDKVMGPDSLPREVTGTHNGYDKMYEVKPVKGAPYYVNSEHILCLWSNKRGGYYEIATKDFVTANKTLKQTSKTYRANTVTFPDVDSRWMGFDPYLFGVWLGDGSSDLNGLRYTNVDTEITDAVSEIAAGVSGYWHSSSHGEVKAMSHGVVNRQGKTNAFVDVLRSWGVANNKHIPSFVKTSPVWYRRSVLAGIVDTDGYVFHGCYDIVQKNKTLADDIAFLCRSLGLAAYVREVQKGCQTGAVGTYYRVSVSGDLSEIPARLPRKQVEPRKQIKDVLKTGITVTKVSDNEQYFGFSVEGPDKNFLLSDFTVVHNTAFVKSLMLNLYQTTTEKIGAIFLEESVKQSIYQFMSLEMQRNINNPYIYEQTDKTDILKTWDRVFKSDRWMFWDHFGSSSLDQVCEQVRFMAVNWGASYIVLDHISIIVSSQENGDERKALDEIMTRLRKLCEELGICIVLVSHLKRPSGQDGHENGGVTSLAQLRGSAGIGQLADVVLGIERNGQHDEPRKRNLSTVRVLKSRKTGLTGPAAKLYWDNDKYSFTEVPVDGEDEFFAELTRTETEQEPTPTEI